MQMTSPSTSVCPSAATGAGRRCRERTITCALVFPATFATNALGTAAHNTQDTGAATAHTKELVRIDCVCVCVCVCVHRFPHPTPPRARAHAHTRQTTTSHGCSGRVGQGGVQSIYRACGEAVCGGRGRAESACRHTREERQLGADTAPRGGSPTLEYNVSKCEVGVGVVGGWEVVVCCCCDRWVCLRVCLLLSLSITIRTRSHTHTHTHTHVCAQAP